MSYTTTNMSAPRIWESDQEMRAARRAGWRRIDLVWERATEAANEALKRSDTSRAVKYFRHAYLLAWFGFSRSDPRFATSLANMGVVASLAGKMRKSARRFDRAKALWAKVPDGLPGITIAPRARSSLFHLRMEARHRETYHDNMRIRIGKFVEETADALADLAEGRTPRHRLYSRWRGEKPNVFDDTRKFLSAALLLTGEKNINPDDPQNT